MSAPREKKRGEDGEVEDVSPFENIQKNLVLREAQVFHSPQISVSKCTRVLTRILYLLNQGEQFSKDEATEVFFSVTKLFQSQDPSLRRLVYLFIKELTSVIGSDESLIVVAPLNKDMTSKNDIFRANAIRVLAKIMDSSMVGAVERFLKQAIVDKNPFVVSSTLLAGAHMYRGAPDVIKRWTNEVQEALTNRSKLVQFHALGLMYQIKSSDRLAISKTVAGLTKTQPRSSLAQVLHVRMAAEQLIQTNPPDENLLKFLEESLRSKTPMVAFEAARAMCRAPNLVSRQVMPAVSVLRDMLLAHSPNHLQRFAAVRTFSEMVDRHPLLVSSASSELEHLISDGNRSVATLAVTTLLRTGVESNVDRLMKSITGFLSDISEDFKIVLVDALRTLCLKFPHKHQGLLAVLSNALREEGGPKFKKAIVDAILAIVDQVKDARELGLDHLCEFIEDCEFPDLSIRILHFIGDKGPGASNPAKYVRHLFNRVILETASVRCAAVAALAKIGANVPALAEHIVVLLKRCLLDNDDELRDRASFYIQLLSEPAAKSAGVSLEAPGFSLASLEASLQRYLDQPEPPQEFFSIDKHRVEVAEDEEKGKTESDSKGGHKEEKQAVGAGGAAAAAATPGGPAPVSASAVNPHWELLSSIPEIKELGTLFKSSPAVMLTEAETEYVVSCVKHIFPSHVVLQYNITNNMESQHLENVYVDVLLEDGSEWNVEFTVPEPSIAYHAAGSAFVCLRRPVEAALAAQFKSGVIGNTLKFTAKDVVDGDVAESGMDDEYQLEELELSEGDFMRSGAALPLAEFKRQWESLGAASEVVKKFSLGLQNLQAAVDAIIDLLGMKASEQSHQVKEGASTHTANLSSVFFGDVPVFARAGFVLDPKIGVTLKIAIRSSNPELSVLLTNAIR